VRFYKFDTDNAPDFAQELEVRSVPAFYFFKDGEKVSSYIGANSQNLLSVITALL
jgi:thioredoxin 1